MNEAVRWRLFQNDCQNRGYILDGYPKSYENSNGIFYKLPEQPKKPEPVEAPKAEGEDEDAEPPAQEEEEVDEEEVKRLKTPIFQEGIYPSSVILLRGTEKEVHKKAEDLPNEKVVGTHWNPSDIDRRMREWNRNNSLNNYKAINENNSQL
jgi:adenylate kinase